MEVNKTDKSNMRQTILDFPGQFGVGLKIAEGVKASGSFDEVLICGMGGSALAADLLQLWLDEYKISLPLYVHRNYGIPEETDKDYLVICVSYSGNTEETISAFQEARKNNYKIAAITSGGKLGQLCKKYKVPVVILPKGYQPRMTLGFQLSALMKLLVNCGILNNGLEKVDELQKTLKPKLLENKGKSLAKKLTGSIPVVYSSDAMKKLARIWKIKFNENSKMPAFWNFFPELNHNEMVGYTTPSKLHVLILRDESDNARNQKRVRLTSQLLKKKGFPVDIIEISGKDILYKVFNSILLADWTSYYLALELGHDPTPVDIVEDFKKKMA